MVNFGKFPSENTVIFADFSPKITTMRPKVSPGVLIKSGVLFARIRYIKTEFLRTFIFDGLYFGAPKLQECVAPFWKLQMCPNFEPEGQGRGSTFRVCHALKKIAILLNKSLIPSHLKWPPLYLE